MNTNRNGWECGHYMQLHLEWLYQMIDKLQQETTYQSMVIESLKANNGQEAVAAHMPTSQEAHEAMLNSIARHLSELPENERDEVVSKSRAWANGQTWAKPI